MAVPSGRGQGEKLDSQLAEVANRLNLTDPDNVSSGSYTRTPCQDAADIKASKSSDEEDKSSGNWAEREEVPEKIKLEWEREQEHMKARLLLVDCAEVKNVCAAHKVAIQAEPGLSQFYIAGVDISFVKGDNVNACTGLVVLQFPSLQVVYEDFEMIRLTAPYIPGFLGFREVPHLYRLFQRLKATSPQYEPQVVMVDGNGVLHPRGFGSACHLGVMLDKACIGVAKKLFKVDGLEKNEEHQAKIAGLKNGGDTFPLTGMSGQVLGKALRSHDGSATPVYVSAGHKISLETAVWLVHRCCKFRVPEPVRLADVKSREYLRQNFDFPESAEPDDKQSEDSSPSDGTFWQFLEHKGPVFAPEYSPLPTNVGMLYNGRPVRLSLLAEEAAFYYTKTLGMESFDREFFNCNFFKCWREVMTPEEREVILDFNNCDFTEIRNYQREQSEQRRHLPADVKKSLKEENMRISAEYGSCNMDGKTVKVVGFHLSPPGVFVGRGNHPYMGMLKKRIAAEDVTINCSRDSRVPSPPPGHQWKEVKHDNKVQWLACWEENLLGEKFMMPVRK